MRRGTPSAEFIGSLLFLLRQRLDITMRDAGNRISCPATTISKVEKGKIALKEPKIDLWAAALEIERGDLQKLWNLTQGIHPETGCYGDNRLLLRRISGIMEIYVPGWEDQTHIPEDWWIPVGPIHRRRTSSVRISDLNTLVNTLTAPERERVKGYVESLIENR